MQDNGPNPYIVDIEELTLDNDTFRTVAWTGKNMQMTVMAIEPGDDIGLEVHADHDQFLRIEQGEARVELGPNKDELTASEAEEDFAIFVPAGIWHNLTNIGDDTLKLYSIYTPPEHAHGTIHQTKAIADAAEHDHHA